MTRDKVRFFTVFIGVLLILMPQNAHSATLESLDASAASVFVYINNNSSNANHNFMFHSDVLEAEKITVLSLQNILDAQEKRARLPSRSIALTFDNPDQFFFKKIWPILREKNIPATIFVTPYPESIKDDNALSWAQIDQMLRDRPDLITVGLTLYNEITPATLNSATAIFREKLQITPIFFSYGGGVYNENAVKSLENAGFKAAFGQQSGVTSYLSDRYRLPRFTMTEDLGDVDRFVMVAAALPFPATDIQPRHNFIDADTLAVGFTASEMNLKNLSCFSSQDGKIIPNILADKRIELRIPRIEDTGKIRINCTIPVTSKIAGDTPRYRWLGFLFISPEKTVTDTAIELNETGLAP
jgi:poly-beta-1,6-N-acetyl-D-glucosamine N-deacetylase